jgi:2-keto-4-pentenoate hydratase
MTVWARVDMRAAFKLQMARRDADLANGERALGWKLGSVTPEACARFGIDAPLIGYLLASGSFESGSSVSLTGWTRALIEPEIALYVGADLPAGSSPEQCRAAISAMSLAYELIDVTHDSPSTPQLLEFNAFQRGVVLGEQRPFTSPAPLVNASVNGDEWINSADPAVSVGDMVALTGHLADVLGTLAGGLRAGDVVISGAVGGAVSLSPGDRHTASAQGLGEIAIDFTA